ncbi:hypothetical protein CCR94_01330 [Rhodoblastus sphagnicola]|uniref:Uncharacterized protein n=1 Tax=Rhodoblastus sphagnicola TaxID=333368 RepID=A0A2S6NG04_9HYPH|nr:hypothetical protein [Rhodoblastus sphagnicola]MBB4199518.1 hypothetical protein [Rhodoblastus sphagnicola]PPQ33524.1 hypothetical protein CCR94_01330 [Rhodoblastus sphagnicola]
MAHRDKFGRTTFGRKSTRQDDTGETPAPIPIDLPLKLCRSAEAFSILDAADRAVCHIYFEDEPTRRQAMRLFTEAQARQISQTIARMLTDADGTGVRAGSSMIPFENLNAETDE